MDEFRPPVDRPWWVRLVLWGLATRYSAWGSVWLSVAVGVLCMIYGSGKRWWLVAAVVWFVAATVYLLAIRWVDRNASWR